MEHSSLGPLAEAVQDGLGQFDAISLGPRLAAADPTIWSSDPEVTGRIARRLGWIASAVAAPARGMAAATGSVMLLGMGGSSLGAEACARAFGAVERLRIVDSTIPGEVLGVDEWLAGVTDVVVASKSGATVETVALADYFERRCDGSVRFHAVTDPGSELEARAATRRYASCHLNAPDIGGRFSVLSLFGSVPLALAGVDMDEIQLRAAAMASRCATATASENPGLWLGAVLAAAAATGIDKMVLLAEPGLEGLADWIEQLVAESTGKDGLGIVPVTHAEPDAGLGMPADRIVVLLEWSAAAPRYEDQVAAWVQAGVPVVRLALRDPYDIGAEFYRWQVAVAAVGSALGINPFDEPNVASAKQRTAEVLRTGSADHLRRPPPDWSGEQVQLFASGAAGSSGGEILSSLVAPTVHGYMGLLAFLPRDRAVEAALGRIREELRGPNPVTLGWGPRYLHSVGQLHKGGPPTGRFLMLTSEDGDDVAIPDHAWTFGTLARAQALGDAQALEESGRMVVRAHLSGPIDLALAELVGLVQRAR